MAWHPLLRSPFLLMRSQGRKKLDLLEKEAMRMKKGITNDEILTRTEAAGMLKMPRRTLDYLVATGQIPFSRIGKRGVRFTRGRLLEWRQEREGIEYRLPRVTDGISG